VDDTANNTLSEWLGLPYREGDIDASLKEKLAALPRAKEDTAAIQTMLERSWSIIERRIGQPPDTILTVIGEKLAAWRMWLSRPLVLVPGGALAVIVCAVLTWQFFRAQNTIWMYLDNSPHAQKVDLVHGDFSTTGTEPVRSHLDRTALTLKNVKKLAAQKNAEGMQLNFLSGDVLIAYTQSPERPKLTIKTQAALYRVIGTRFLIRAGEQTDRLFVQEGKVRVAAKDKTVEVAAGHLWSSEKPGEVLADTASVDEAFNDLMAGGQRSGKPKKQRIAKRLTTLHMVNGSILKGNLLSETSTHIEIHSVEMAKRLHIAKEDIARIER
jgi:ferric-dicitrate binding protein FerR (iron transport regulator)